MHRLAVIALLLLLGCQDPGIAQLETIRAEICACKTARCGEQAMERVNDVQLESTPRAQQIARAMMDCLAKLYDTERPETGPDGEAGEPAEPGEPGEPGEPPAPGPAGAPAGS